MQHELTVYLITNAANGKRYIGRTSHPLSLRLSHHVSEAFARGAKWPLQRAMRKHGRRHFTIEPLCKVSTLGESYLAERFYIALLGTRVPGGYNLNPGGAGRGFGYRHDQETLRKIGAGNRGKIMPREAVERIAAKLRGRPSPFKGCHRSEEVRAKMRAAKLRDPKMIDRMMALAAARRGKHLSPEHKAKISAFMLGNKYGLGRHPSQEARDKMSASRRGKVFSQEHLENMSKAIRGSKNWNFGKKTPANVREKIRRAMTGKRLSAETRAKVSAGQRARWARQKSK
jgi:group I intron endonuclease